MGLTFWSLGMGPAFWTMPRLTLSPKATNAGKAKALPSAKGKPGRTLHRKQPAEGPEASGVRHGEEGMSERRDETGMLVCPCLQGAGRPRAPPRRPRPQDSLHCGKNGKSSGKFRRPGDPRTASHAGQAQPDPRSTRRKHA